MAFKYLAIFACVAVASAGLLPEAQLEKAEDFDPHPSYSFSYEVQDDVTGDVKSQSENRDGDVVQGQYSLNDADGYRRIVEYTADAVNGFNAVVRREPLGVASAPVVAAPAEVPAPVPAPAATPAPVRAPAPAPKPVLPQRIALQSPVVALPAKQQTYLNLNTYAQPAAYIRTYSAPTVVHHAPTHALIHSAPEVHHASTHTLIHSAPTVHLAPASHIVHEAPTTHLVKTVPTTVIAHHAPAVVKTSFASPHYSHYVY